MGFFNYNQNDHLDLILNEIGEYKFGQYKHYPSTNLNGWKIHYSNYITQLLSNEEWEFYIDSINGKLLLLGCRFSKWDTDQLGVNTVTICVLLGDNEIKGKKLDDIIVNFNNELRNREVEFAIFRINGDLLDIIHSLENNGYNYYENIIWPVLKTNNSISKSSKKVRLANKDDFNEILNIASSNTYERGHFYCDTNLDKLKVDGIYTKIVVSSWKKGDNFVVIEDNKSIKGYFIFKDDPVLSKSLGLKYARMYSLALSKDSRGKGLGSEIFEGMISIATKLGAEVIDSGYATKNHKSAYLHTINKFYSVYEEITFHKWFK